MAGAGLEVTVIRGWLCHADLSTTNSYAEINAEIAAPGNTEPPGLQRTQRGPIWQTDETLLDWLT